MPLTPHVPDVPNPLQNLPRSDQKRSAGDGTPITDETRIYYERPTQSKGPDIAIDRTTLVTNHGTAGEQKSTQMVCIEESYTVGEFMATGSEAGSPSPEPSADAGDGGAPPRDNELKSDKLDAGVSIDLSNVSEDIGSSDERHPDDPRPRTLPTWVPPVNPSDAPHPDDPRPRTLPTYVPRDNRPDVPHPDDPRPRTLPTYVPPDIRPKTKHPNDPTPRELPEYDRRGNAADIAPTDPRVLDDSGRGLLLDALESTTSMTFSSAEAEAAYQNQQIADAMSAVGDPNPGGVVSKLRAMGITNEEGIDRVRAEVIAVLVSFKAGVARLQAHLASLDTSVEHYTDTVNGTLNAWRSEFGADFAVGSIGQVRASSAVPLSPAGIRVQTRLGVHRSGREGSTFAIGSIEPGYEFRAGPVISLEHDNAWKLKA